MIPYKTGYAVAIRGVGDQPIPRELAEKIARGAARELGIRGYPIAKEPA